LPEAAEAPVETVTGQEMAAVEAAVTWPGALPQVLQHTQSLLAVAALEETKILVDAATMERIPQLLD
jgi:hypothetical protein